MLDAELTIVGPDGPLRGGPGPRGGTAIVVLDVRHTLVSPRDLVTGQATGKRQHAPIIVVKDVDRSTPVLLNAWARNDELASWRLDVFGSDQVGRRREAYTIELQGAFVAEVSLTTSETSTPLQESVSFVYKSISWTWHDGNLAAHDEWVE